MAAASGEESRRLKTDAPAQLTREPNAAIDEAHVAAMKDVTDALPQAVPPTIPAPAAAGSSVKTAQPATAAVAAARGDQTAVADLTLEAGETRKLKSSAVRKTRTEPVAAAIADTDTAPRTQIVRGKPKPQRGDFEQDPVVGWLVIIGGPGLG
ncbi:MAG: hypothetical protein AAGJ53_10370, partial [Pseudomonadota bacterium]